MTCSVAQVGDREWWCSTHRRNAEDCAPPRLTPLGTSVVNRQHPWGPNYHRLRAVGLPQRTALLLAVHGYQPVSVAALDRVRELERLEAS